MAKKTYDLLFKLLLIGDSGVGKTCILFRYEIFGYFKKNRIPKSKSLHTVRAPS